MAKRKKTIKSGRMVRSYVYTAPTPQDGPKARAEKAKASSAARKAMNDKTAKRKLALILETNFTRSDSFVTLTFDDEHLPASREEALRYVTRFVDDLRKSRKLRGRPLRYVYTIEHKHGDGRWHAHCVIDTNGTEADREEIRSLWKGGTIVDIRTLKTTKGLEGLAQYMTKEADDRRVGARMWVSSLHLKKPEVKYEWVSDEVGLAAPPGAIVLAKEEKGLGEYGWYSYIEYYIPEPGSAEAENASFDYL